MLHLNHWQALLQDHVDQLLPAPTLFSGREAATTDGDVLGDVLGIPKASMHQGLSATLHSVTLSNGG